MDVSLEQGGVSVKLMGSGISAPVRAGKIELAPGLATLELALDGTAGSIASFQQSLEKALYLSTLYAGLPGADQGYLKITLADATVWTAPVRAGRCVVAKPGPGSRSVGSQGLRVELELEDYWESTTITDVPLSNKYGSNVTAGLQVDNHDDAGHDNWVNIAAAAILGDIPAPAIITLTSVTAGLDVMLAQMVDYSSAFVGVLEGEAAGVGGTGPPVLTPTADGSCSGGNYGALGWTGTTYAALTWGLDADNSRYYGGRVFRPVVRLRDLVAAGEKMWAYWEIANSVGGWDFLSVSDGVVLPLDSRLMVFPPMAIPPWPKAPAGFSWEPVLLVLVIYAEGAGAHVFNIDFVGMLACDGWVRFLPIVEGLATSIRYEGGTGLITRATTGMVSHAPDGPGLLLYPGVNQKIQILSQVAPLADTGTAITLKLQYKARKRVL